MDHDGLNAVGSVRLESVGDQRTGRDTSMWLKRGRLTQGLRGQQGCPAAATGPLPCRWRRRFGRGSRGHATRSTLGHALGGAVLGGGCSGGGWRTPWLIRALRTLQNWRIRPPSGPLLLARSAGRASLDESMPACPVVSNLDWMQDADAGRESCYDRVWDVVACTWPDKWLVLIQSWPDIVTVMAIIVDCHNGTACGCAPLARHQAYCSSVAVAWRYG